jgi:hypothetical protein
VPLAVVFRHLRGAAARTTGYQDRHGDLDEHRPATRRRDRLDGVGAPRHQPHERRREQRGGRVADRSPRAVGELADRSGADAEVGGDPLVAVALQGVPHDHLPLSRRQRTNRADHAPEPLAPLEDLVGALDAVQALGQRIEPGVRVARHVQRGVMGHAVQPRPERDRSASRIARERGVGIDERLLQRVLRRRG